MIKPNPKKKEMNAPSEQSSGLEKIDPPNSKLVR